MAQLAPQLAPSTQPAARPFSPTQNPRAAENTPASTASAFAGQLDQALAGAADNRPADTSPLAGLVATAPDPAAAAVATKPTAPPQSPPLPVPAANVPTPTVPAPNVPAKSQDLLGKGATTRTAAAAKPETDKGEIAAPGSSLTPDSQPAPPADPTATQPATIDTHPALATAQSAVGAVPADTATPPLSPREPVGGPALALPTIGAAVPSGRASPARAELGKQPTAADQAAFEPTDRPAQEQIALAHPPGAPALTDVGPKLATGQTNLPSAGRAPQTGAASGEAVADLRGGRTSAPSQPPRSDDLPPESKPVGASTASPDTAPPSPAPVATNAAAPLSNHPALVLTPSAPPPSSGVSAQAAAAAPPPSPSAQVAAAVNTPVQVTLANPPQSSGGAQTLTIHLKPDELGRVEIRIERPADGPARVELAAERPETLLRLVHDQAQLQQALDQAGIPPTGRTIHFSLSSDPSSSTGFGANSSGANTSGDGASGRSGQRSQQGYADHASGSPNETDLAITATAWARTGLDITA